MSNFVILENTLDDKASSFYFHDPHSIISCTDSDKLPEAFAKLAKMQSLGFYLVGFVAYEAIYGIDKSILRGQSYTNKFPLLYFLAFKDLEKIGRNAVDEILMQASISENAKICRKTLSFSEEEYYRNIDKIKKYIEQGQTYQVNYTGKYKFDYLGSPAAIYKKLRAYQQVAYAAFFALDEMDILSLSPELFFKKSGKRFVTQPMKGTMPRGENEAMDLINANFLRSDPKTKAENLMIVDLLRNDLSKIAKPLSVQVLDLFKIASFTTVHQMISTIACEVDSSLSFKDIIYNIFPCGSITGAPKHRTMQIIKELEPEPRKIYTGAIGYITPQNDMCFNVAIRTLLLQNNVGELGVGGGILIDSDSKEEYQEAILKSRFMDVALDKDDEKCVTY